MVRDGSGWCLLAKRLVERGVRMVQVYFGNGQPWDNHDDIQIHRRLALQADKPIASLSPYQRNPSEPVSHEAH